MAKGPSFILATEFYPPDPSTTAIYLGAIADAIALDMRTVVLSGTPGSTKPKSGKDTPEVIEIANWRPPKQALVRRFIASCVLAIRLFWAVYRRATAGDVVMSVTSPFTLPYAITLAARLRGAKTALLIYDLYPEALLAAGMARQTSFITRALRIANGWLFSSLNAIFVIGRDVPPLLLRYPRVRADNIHFVPNWTLLPIGFRHPDHGSDFRKPYSAPFIVGLCGNLGFTHAPRTVFDAARHLQHKKHVHFVLSGWGVGWNELKALQASDNLANVTLLDPVPEEQLAEFLAAADAWIIPYRRNVAGVSIPSRLYNLLAVGRAVIVGTEPNSEAGLAVTEEDIGWVVPPEDPIKLAQAISEAASDRAATLERGRKAAVAALNYSEQASTLRYREIMKRLLEDRV
ncbi:glycosyltransferase family 4 protein [Bradyrhizobium sp. DASA03005]|uniref:glycosyltransferase family 4 protein n=1 Tax=Bradyrhizobium TaxID=374 RepID=UPI00155EB249|nr:MULTISPECIES: glycosyltransferase family 4 protein [Bradyrhizobium]MDD1518412.1 glycosyltransferase WbuB [Bradyrhizobium sp. WBAH30]MDD1542210.1 glycosyltransferase WbuB [Bradyrhizobium sp. WBAH41]MDD1556362.1 glycosyltransferase WbuB [Bradyrhizobium sp. WBAH23]MDD1561797.1 glycosyltransferase WbuB [Bradyrhizobium sp. WBAH33]MDD1589181.1 glycosyltransferase WbuB [Bradyrhizobium sp. WBAH42]